MSYEQSKYIIEEVRRRNELKLDKTKGFILPQIPSKDEIRGLLEISLKSNYTHYLVIRLLMGTGARVSELINIKCKDVYLSERKIFINGGKGNKDRYVLFPKDLLSDLVSITQKKRGDENLIVSRFHKKYTRQGVALFMREYVRKLGIDKKISPHSLRHYFTTIVSSAMSDSEAMLLTGHSDKKTIAIYQHMSVDGNLRDKYDECFGG